jgi:hypothetical protein
MEREKFNFDIDVTGVECSFQDIGEIFGKLTREESVLRLFRVHTGFVPGEGRLRFYTAGSNLGNCCEDRNGTGEFSQKLIPVECISVGNEFCLADLKCVLQDLNNIRFTAGNESAGSLIDLFVNQELANTSFNIDRLVFQGDTTSGDPNLNKLDGLIKQATNATDSIKLGQITTGNILDAITRVIAAMPVQAQRFARTNGGIDVFIDPNVAFNLHTGLVMLNQYNYNPGSYEIDGIIRIPWLNNVTIYPTDGLEGTNTIIATPIANIHWLTNLENDYLTAYSDYSYYHKRFFWDIQFLLGVGFGFDEWVVIATYTDAVAQAAVSFPVSIVSPLNAAGTAVQTEEVAP